jgi:hypothetical protein
VRSRHSGAAPDLAAPASVKPDAARRMIDLDNLIAAAAAATNDVLSARHRAVRKFMREPFFLLAARVLDALRDIDVQHPGAGLGFADLRRHLKVDQPTLAGALALLDEFRVLEIEGEKARISRGFGGDQ